MITSAQEATRTRLCDAEACGNDAETNSRLCWRCQRKDSVRLHVEPPRLSGTLRCCTCDTFKPDGEFSRKADAHHRRQRHHECKQCAKTRRSLARLNPQYLAREHAAKNARRAEQRELLRLLREGYE